MKALVDFKRFYTEGNNMARKLVIVNVIVFLLANLVTLVLWLIVGGAQFESMLLMFTGFFSVPADLATYIIRPWTLITHSFFHVDFVHFLVNMVILYWLGNIYREYAGNAKALSTYIWGGVAGGVFYLIANSTFPVLANHSGMQLHGASAAVLAIVVALGAFIPYFEVTLFNFFIPLRWVSVGVVAIVLASTSPDNIGGQMAHLGGILFGLVYGWQMRRRNSYGGGFENISDFVGKLFKRKSKLTVVKKETTIYSTTTVADFDDEYEPNQEEVDAILDKISQSGYESLTRKERELLYKASKQH